MEENYFSLEVDEEFINHFQNYTEYLEKHHYPIEKSVRIQNKIFDFVNHSLLTGEVNFHDIEGGKIKKFIIEDQIVYYTIQMDRKAFVLLYAKSTRQNRKPGY